MTYTCPVCHYSSLPWPPDLHNICVCCGTEFGFDDFESTFDQLRVAWVRAGGLWFSSEFPPPDGWSATSQLIQAGFRG